MKCECGHVGIDHVLLPGHPDGAMECYGTDYCECGRWRPRKEAAVIDFQETTLGVEVDHPSSTQTPQIHDSEH